MSAPAGGFAPHPIAAGLGAKRELDCERYDDCLDVAIKNDWKGFTCVDCPLRGRAPACSARERAEREGWRRAGEAEEAGAKARPVTVMQKRSAARVQREVASLEAKAAGLPVAAELAEPAERLPRLPPGERRPCVEPDCDRFAIAKGLCGRHYERARQKGLRVVRPPPPPAPPPPPPPPAPPRQVRFCSEANCDREALCRGLCKRHYDLARYHGEILRRPCSEAGCDRHAVAKGRCGRHAEHARWREREAASAAPPPPAPLEQAPAPAPSPPPDPLEAASARVLEVMRRARRALLVADLVVLTQLEHGAVAGAVRRLRDQGLVRHEGLGRFVVAPERSS